MKILFKGTTLDDIPIQADCKKCMSRIEFTIGEARDVSDPRDGNAWVVDCPVCKAEIWVAQRRS